MTGPKLYHFRIGSREWPRTDDAFGAVKDFVCRESFNKMVGRSNICERILILQSTSSL